MTKTNSQGFTLIELLVVMGIIAVLSAVVLVALNPGRHFAQARNTQRASHVNTILNAISQNMADHKGVFTCAGVTTLPTTPTIIRSTNTAGINIAPCLVPDYLSTMPFDPTASNARYTSTADYDTGYEVSRDQATGRITITAPATELGLEKISVSR
jgi:prepilin-type N-terminal cleavage/methylation domain-containing protein